jgi:hypothetical protein
MDNDDLSVPFIHQSVNTCLSISVNSSTVKQNLSSDYRQTQKVHQITIEKQMIYRFIA